MPANREMSLAVAKHVAKTANTLASLVEKAGSGKAGWQPMLKSLSAAAYSAQQEIVRLEREIEEEGS